MIRLPAEGAPRRVVVYTCTFLDYDDVFSPVRLTPGVEFVLISDRRPRLVRGWRWRPLPAEVEGMSQTLANRWCKFFPHRLFPDADVSIYLDGNVLILDDLGELVIEFLESGAGIGLFLHHERTSIEAEISACLKAGKIPLAEASRAARQLRRYRDAGLPDPHVLTENGVIFRRHDAAGLDAAMTLWWSELDREVKRDQISLPYVLHASSLLAKVWKWSYKSGNPYFMKYPHRKTLARRIGTYLYVRSKYGPAQAVFFRLMLGAFGRTRDILTGVPRR